MHPKVDSPTEVIPLVPDPPPRRRSTVKWLAGGIVVVIAAVAAGIVVTRHRASGQPAAPGPSAVETVKLERRDLSTTKQLDGSIGFGASRPLAGHTEATVTWLPAVGATIKRGQQLFRADDKPVSLFYGRMPLYRPIAGRQLVGRDVRIVADNLRALGYGIGNQPSVGERVTRTEPAPVASAAPAAGKAPETPPAAAKSTTVKVRKGDGVLTTGLIAAIKDWQQDRGLPVTGRIAVGDVEVLPGAIRVDALAVQPGSPANGPLMSVTSTRKVITVPAELGDAAVLERGKAVTVTLPDDRTVKARISSVGRTLAAPEGAVADGEPTMTVAVTVDDPKAIADLDSADVRVNVAGTTVEDVLAAPIEALIALTEGGYAVQGPGGLVAVKTGMFADGWVEISGAGLDAGTDVVVAS
ncbi:efflux RND transporter periplasmic adaptor subunit [Actinoplanes auranticolor]|uniref:Peptidoglycan-binding protein n=1 Tax=Actinoplanes auranticolor TaxID=47988 RepID=A0A919S6U7_9ACTN|nr:efflux RND transporter periplasmic adaptor subunit [Actinoplanes auranticolor]GIM65082.1 peptidoglycan-binding protein [Actinoplanes auranticolor]